MSDGFFTLDRDFNFTFVNDEFCRVLNKRRDALIGNNIRQCFPAAANSAFRIEYEAALATQTTRTFTQHYSELNLWLRVKAYPSIDGLAIYFQDVTQERAREQHLRLLESAVSRQNDILLITEAEPMDEPEGPGSSMSTMPSSDAPGIAVRRSSARRRASCRVQKPSRQSWIASARPSPIGNRCALN